MKIVMIGCGVANIFASIELINKGFDGNKITIYEKGRRIENRRCFVTADTPCKKCRVCSIIYGCAGAGSFSDSKLNFDTTGRVGSDLAELMTEKEITDFLKRVYDIYKQFGIEEFKSKAYGRDKTEKASEIINKIKDNPKLDIGECITIHAGSENSRIIYARMIDFLEEHGVNIKHNCDVVDVKDNMIWYKENNILKCDTFDKLSVGAGRSGNNLVREICLRNDIKMKNGKVELGCRIECPNEVMKDLNENFYELKTYFKGSFGDSARTFCNNPGGFVSIEGYNVNDQKLYTANGHSYMNKKSDNTNFAILVSRHFNEDMVDPLTNYVFPLMLTTNSLGNNSVIMQSLKDIKLNRRSTEERIKELDIIPTASCYIGDLTSAVPFRTLTTILEFIEELDTIAPGINGDNTLLYGLEVKLTSNKVLIDKYGKSSNKNIYFIGDASGWNRGLTTSAGMGLLMVDDILKG